LSGLYPTLAGMDAAVIYKQLDDYRAGKRSWSAMNGSRRRSRSKLRPMWRHTMLAIQMVWRQQPASGIRRGKTRPPFA
jgi:hypothetical protein